MNTQIRTFAIAVIILVGAFQENASAMNQANFVKVNLQVMIQQIRTARDLSLENQMTMAIDYIKDLALEKNIDLSEDILFTMEALVANPEHVNVDDLYTALLADFGLSEDTALPNILFYPSGTGKTAQEIFARASGKTAFASALLRASPLTDTLEVGWFNEDLFRKIN